jgi:hypothetical protein
LASKKIHLHSFQSPVAAANLLFSLSSEPLQPHQSIFFVVYIFSSLLPFWQSLFCHLLSMSAPPYSICPLLYILHPVTCSYLHNFSFFSGSHIFLPVTL